MRQLLAVRSLTHLCSFTNAMCFTFASTRKCYVIFHFHFQFYISSLEAGLPGALTQSHGNEEISTVMMDFEQVCLVVVVEQSRMVVFFSTCSCFLVGKCSYSVESMHRVGLVSMMF